MYHDEHNKQRPPSLKSQAIMRAVRRFAPRVMHENLAQMRESQDNLYNILRTKRTVGIDYINIDGLKAAYLIPQQEQQDRVILYLHGGAFNSGTIKYAVVLGSRIADVAKMRTLALEYRLAPEHVFPAQLDDALKAWHHLLAAGYKPNNIYLAGESSGGNLVLSLALKLKELGLALPGRIVCMSPWTVLPGNTESYQSNKEADPTIDGDELMFSARLYAPDNNLQDPLISPVYEDFTDFPPVLIHVGSIEVLLDDSLFLAEALKRDNVPCILKVFEGMLHVFQLYPFAEAEESMHEIGAFLNEDI